MPIPSYAWYLVHLDYAEIKFVETISTTTLVNANFTLYDVTIPLSPVAIADPFNTIDLTRDYHSISRTLDLWFKIDLVANTDYEIRISGLKTIIGESIDSDVLPFSSGSLVDEQANLPSTRDVSVVDVEDYSIKGSLFESTIAIENTGVFQILSVVPDTTISYYLSESYNEGRIEITFSDIPAANFISGEYFKVQRKLIGRGLNAWETVSAIVTSSPENKLVVIYLPSNDATPVFAEPDLIYWEPGYKYRLRISPLIGI